MRQAIVVLGMHRSGTSMLSGVLNLAGLDLGKHLWQADHANQKGYFENSRIGIFNDQLLDLICATWDDTLLLPEHWWEHDTVTSQMERFAEIIAEEFDTDHVLLFKDPRICVLLPFYLMAFEQQKIQPYFVISFRDPFEVAASMKKRNNLPVSRGLLLWMDHNLKAENYTRIYPRVFIKFDRVLIQPIAFLNRISDEFNLNFNLSDDQNSLICSFVEKDLKHHNGEADPELQQVPAMVHQLYRLICKVEEVGFSSSNEEQFNMLAACFYDTCSFYHGFDPDSRALIQLETITGKRMLYSTPIHIGHNKLDFLLDFPEPVTRIVLNPCNQMSALIVHQVLISDPSADQSSVGPSYHNAQWSDPDGTLVFETVAAEITFLMEPSRIVTQIHFDLTYCMMGFRTMRYGIQKRSKFIADRESKETGFQ